MILMDIVVEIHVPLEEVPDAPEGSYLFPWIDQVEDFLAEQEAAEVYDDGEEYDGVYVFFITGAAGGSPGRGVWHSRASGHPERSVRDGHER